VDVVDLGVLEASFGGKTSHKHFIRIVWQIEEVMPDNRPFIVMRRYTLSLHEKSTLRKDLESWRGREFTEEELDGFDVEKLIGVPCLLNVVQIKKQADTFANVASIMRLPKGMNPLQGRDYIRVKDRDPKEQEQHSQIDDDSVPF